MFYQRNVVATETPQDEVVTSAMQEMKELFILLVILRSTTSGFDPRCFAPSELSENTFTQSSFGELMKCQTQHS